MTGPPAGEHPRHDDTANPSPIDSAPGYPDQDAQLVELDRFAVERGGLLPAAWRDHLRRPRRFGRGWLPGGDYLWIYSATETVELTRTWTEWGDNHPGVLGGDGGPQHLAIDVRRDDTPVYTLPNVSDHGWADGIVQATSVQAFVDAIESGVFTYRYDN